MTEDTIKRGYPNPNYSEKDIIEEDEAELLADIGLVTVGANRYEELVSKAAALDILTSDIKSRIDSGDVDYHLVDGDLVLAVTGMSAYKRLKKLERLEAPDDGQN